MRLGIRAKLVLASVVVLVVISFGFTALQLAISRAWVEEDLEERAIAFAREVAVTIADRREFESAALLGHQIEQILAVRRNVLQIDVLALDGGPARVVASSHPSHRLPFTRHDSTQIRQGRVVSRLVRDDSRRYWEVMAPVALEGAVVGAVAAKFSLERADALAARVAAWALGLTAASIATMALLMSGVIEVVVNRPLRRFVAAVSAAAENAAAPVTVEVATGDELGLLARHFNDMMRRIAAFNDELQRQVRAATAEADRRYDEVQRLNDLLFRMQRSLSHAERLVLSGRIVAQVAHEVGTPLHSIAGHLELLRKDLAEDVLAAGAGRRLAIVEGEIARVIEVLARLLNLARRDTGRPAAVDVNRIVRDTVDLVRPAAAESGLHLVVRTAPDVPAIQGFSSQVQQVVLNLLTNAIDATPPGGTVEALTRAALEGVEIAVRDTGGGIAPEALARIFEPFFSTKPPGKGTGLGLFIASQIARAHGGRLVVESAAGTGSLFRLTLPVRGVPE